MVGGPLAEDHEGCIGAEDGDDDRSHGDTGLGCPGDVVGDKVLCECGLVCGKKGCGGVSVGLGRGAF